MVKTRLAPCVVVVLLAAVAGAVEAPPLPAEITALRQAIEDLSVSFGQAYRQGGQFLEELATLERSIEQSPPQRKAAFRETFDVLRRRALIANPLVSGRPLLYVVRHQYRPDHHNTATMFVTGEINTGSFQDGGALKSIDLAEGGLATTLIELAEGVIRDPEVHFDGLRIVFSMRRNIRDDYHIYEINTDGSGLTQLTTAPGVADIDPLYLPDDSIVFSSTREPKYCMCNRHIMCNLFRMDADGANIHQIGKSTLHEGHSSLMPDGRILYDRWEYVDRNFGDAQGLWTVNPDGTSHCVYWGNNTHSPGGVIDARILPGTQQAICIFGSCHDRPWGALAIIDRRLGIDGREGVIRTWPTDAINRVGKGDWDAFVSVTPKYEDPYPLSDKYFLASRTTGRGEQMGIYLIDTFGNEILLHAEEPGCFDPMPLAPRPRPMTIPSRRDFENATATLYVLDVYEGTHMQGVRRGSVKYLRVVESPEKRFWTHAQWGGQGVHCPAMNWHGFENKRILGTVPVELDGSAYFEIPSDTFIYFQLLDADRMMVQSMRSGMIAQSGEITGCTGCHEGRATAPPPYKGKVPEAFRRPPSRLDGWFGPPRLFSYIDEVQPILDRHCIGCHDYGGKAADKLILAGDRDITFNTSYNELWRKGYIASIGAGPHEIQRPYTWGAHASRMVKTLREGHNDLKLPPEDLERIITWIDINGPYYPRYDCAWPDHLTGRCPLGNAQIQRLSDLTGVAFAQQAAHNTNQGPQVSFDRPERSPCLARFTDKTDPACIEALSIIQSGAQLLAHRPRADMPGFTPNPTDQTRQQRYNARQQIEQTNRRSIRQNQKTYDSDLTVNPKTPQ